MIIKTNLGAATMRRRNSRCTCARARAAGNKRARTKASGVHSDALHKSCEFIRNKSFIIKWLAGFIIKLLMSGARARNANIARK